MTEQFLKAEHLHYEADAHHLSCSNKLADELSAHNHSLLHQKHCLPQVNHSEKQSLNLELGRTEPEHPTVEPFIGLSLGNSENEPALFGPAGPLEKHEEPRPELKTNFPVRTPEGIESEWHLGVRFNY